MAAILELIAGVIIDCLLGIFWWLVLFQVVWLVSLPFILVIALFKRMPYSTAVGEMLLSVHISWCEFGPLIPC